MPTELRQHDLEMLRLDMTRQIREEISKQDNRIFNWAYGTVLGFMLTVYAFVLTWLAMADR
ncbi:MAG TPA: hypothetical protein VNU01_08045 [Egibacteraceae bacterium]|nr:hypothetical protein [Egibacteraceae bacterium]